MTEDRYLDVAHAMVEAAQRAGLVTGPLAVVPEMSEIEKRFFITLIPEVRCYLAAKPVPELEADELIQLFNFVSAKAAEAVTVWHTGKVVEPEFERIFVDDVHLECEPAVVENLQKSDVGRVMADAFFDWSAEDAESLPDEEDDGEVAPDPMLPLLEALKWTWRIAAHLTLGFLGR